MSDTYTKLFRSLAASTIVEEPLAARWLWVMLLSQADSTGCVYASVPGLARLANLSISDVEASLARFMAPDPYSRTKDHDGRRIEEIDGGWRLLNHAKYAAIRSAEERREYQRKWDRDHRPSGHARSLKKGHSPTQSDSSPTKSDSPTPPDPTLDLEQQQLPVQEHTPRSVDARVVCVGEAPHSGDGLDQTAEPVTTLAPATALSVALRRVGVTCTPYHPELLAAAAEGVSAAELTALARDYPGKPATYLIRAARRQRAEGAAPIQAQARAGPRSAVARVNEAARRLEERRGRTIDTGAAVAKAARMLGSRGGAGQIVAGDVSDLRASVDVDL